MKNKIPVYYTDGQMAHVMDGITRLFGKGEESMIRHEIESEYVHTDVMTVEPKGEHKVYATVGMGARAMDTPSERPAHIELVMLASPDFGGDTHSKMVIGGELCALSKFPFKNDTWFGVGHTINASDYFKKEFGYDAFIFVDLSESVSVEDVGEVSYLSLLPIYKDEHKYIMQNSYDVFIEWLYDNYGDAAFYVDSKREHFEL